MRHNQKCLNAILEQPNAGLAQADAREHFIFANSRFCEVPDYIQKELLQKNLQDITKQQDRPFFISFFL